MRKQNIISTPAVKTNLRVFGYARESTKDQAFNGFNIDDQEKKIQSYYNIYYTSNDNLTILREEGASAKTMHRPQMESLLEMVKHRKVDVIIIHNLDRLTRRVKDLGMLLELFSEYNVQLVSITEKIDTTSSTGRFFVYMIVLIAQWEQDTISERTIRGMIESANQGAFPLGGKPPFGFDRSNNGDGKLVINEERSKIVLKIFEMIASKAYTVNQVYYYLNQNKILNRTWTQSQLHRILHDSIYYGELQYHGKVYENSQPAIITKELFDKTQDAMRVRRHFEKYKYIFKGYVRCMQCGETCTQFSTVHKDRSKSPTLYYLCKHCRMMINENILMNLVDVELSQFVQGQYFKEKEAELSKQYKYHVSKINSLTTAFRESIIKADYLEDAVKEENDEAEKLIRQLQLIKLDRSHMRFRTLPYSMQRTVLEDYVDSIDIDLCTKHIHVIRYKKLDIKQIDMKRKQEKE